MSEYYMTHTGKELDDAVSKVRSGFIDPADIVNHCTRYVTDYYQADNDKSLADFKLTLGFKPKFFLIRNYGGIQSESNSYYLTSSFFATDDEYNNFTQVMDNGYNNHYKATTFTYYSGNKACAGQSNSDSNTLTPTSDGVCGNKGSTVVLKGGNKYIYYALG